MGGCWDGEEEGKTVGGEMVWAIGSRGGSRWVVEERGDVLERLLGLRLRVGLGYGRFWPKRDNADSRPKPKRLYTLGLSCSGRRGKGIYTYL